MPDKTESMNLSSAQFPYTGTAPVKALALAFSVPAQTDCDGVGTFTCPTGTCYTGLDGFIGCCSVSSCAPRTTCLPYSLTSTSSCDPDTGGCINCPSAAPACVTMTNALEDQYIMYCGATATVVTLSYRNLITAGSTASALPSTTSPTSTTTSTTASNSLTSATSSSSVESSSTSPPSSSSTLSKGAIAGILIGSFFFLALLLTLLFLLCIRPKLARNRQIKYAGGFSVNHNDNDKVTPSTGPLGRLNDLIHGRRWGRWGGREGVTSGSSGGGLGISETGYSSVPWSPTSITAYSPSELHDEPLPSPSPRASQAATQGSPTVRHVMEQASSPSAPAPGNSRSQAYPYASVSGVTPHDSVSVSELSTPPTDTNTPHTSTQMTVSSLNVSRPPSDDTYRRLSARGGGRGYVSPEMAMAHGWRDDGDEENEAEKGQGDGGPAELDDDGNGNGKRGSKGSGNMGRIEEEGQESRNGDMRLSGNRGRELSQ